MNERVRVASMRVYEARERLIGQVWDCGGTHRCCALSLTANCSGIDLGAI